MKDAQAAIAVRRAAGERNIMIDDVYNAKILGFAGNIERIGRLEHPHATAKAHSKLCGSTVTVDLAMENGVVTDFAHDVKACALGQASSSIMARHVIGATAEELRAVRQAMLKMLKENGPPPQGRFGARLQGAPRLHHADLRRRGRLPRPDREEACGGGGLKSRLRGSAGLTRPFPFARAGRAPRE